MNILTTSAICFFIISLVNVILSSAKSICTVRYGRGINVAMNVIAYSFYTVVVKQMTSLPLLTTVIVTALANALGVWLSYAILDKLQKDRLWKVEVVISKEFTEQLHYDLKEIPHNYIELGPKTLFNFYCETKADTSKVIKHCKNFHGKFFAVENKL
jgi:uncharacterized protein YebE (UPF0316 family)